MSQAGKYLATIALVAVGLSLPFMAVAQAPQRASKYLPRLSEIMNAVQSRHSKLWSAGQQQNWELGAYELAQMKASLNDALTLYVDIPVENIDMVEPKIDGLEKAMSAKDSAGFKRGFQELTAGCNVCHRSVGLGYIVMTVPGASPFSNQSFAPRQGQRK